MDTSNSNHSTFIEFSEFNFEGDQRFQTGLKALHAGSSRGDDRSTTESLDSLEARHFYWTKFYKSFDLAEYKEWLLASPPKASLLQSAPPVSAEKTLSFQEIMELVQKGEQVPGIKDIPDVVLELSTDAAKPKLEPIKKPWET